MINTRSSAVFSYARIRVGLLHICKSKTCSLVSCWQFSEHIKIILKLPRNGKEYGHFIHKLLMPPEHKA